MTAWSPSTTLARGSSRAATRFSTSDAGAVGAAAVGVWVVARGSAGGPWVSKKARHPASTEAGSRWKRSYCSKT